MAETPSSAIDTFQQTHDVRGHPLQTAGFLDGAEPACPNCGLHVGGLKRPYQHHRDCPQFQPHPNSISIAAQGA